MLKYLLSKLLYSAALLLGVLFLVFLLLHITGDPVSLMVSRHASPAEIEALREELGFNRPFLVQFFDFLSKCRAG
jgi:peptide/nickel transport system permease protein